MVQGMVGVESSFLDGLEIEELENEGGSCPLCRTRVALWTCSECGTSAWVIECSHRRGSSWLRRGRHDGTRALAHLLRRLRGRAAGDGSVGDRGVATSATQRR